MVMQRSVLRNSIFFLVFFFFAIHLASAANPLAVSSFSPRNIEAGYNAFQVENATAISAIHIYYYNNLSVIPFSNLVYVVASDTAVIQLNATLSSASIDSIIFNITYSNGTTVSRDLLFVSPLDYVLRQLYFNASASQASVQSLLNQALGNTTSCTQFGIKNKSVIPDYCPYITDANATLLFLNSSWGMLSAVQKKTNLSRFILPDPMTVLPVANISDSSPSILALADNYNISRNYSIVKNDSTTILDFLNNSYYAVFPSNNYVVIVTDPYDIGTSFSWKIYVDSNNSILGLVLLFGFLSLIFMALAIILNSVVYRLILVILGTLLAFQSFMIGNFYFAKVYNIAAIINLVPIVALLLYVTALIGVIYASFAILPIYLIKWGWKRK